MLVHALRGNTVVMVVVQGPPGAGRPRTECGAGWQEGRAVFAAEWCSLGSCSKTTVDDIPILPTRANVHYTRDRAHFTSVGLLFTRGDGCGYKR